MAETPSVVPSFNPELSPDSNRMDIMQPEQLSEGIKPYSQIALANQARQAIEQAKPSSILESQSEKEKVIDFENKPIEAVQLASLALTSARREKIDA